MAGDLSPVGSVLEQTGKKMFFLGGWCFLLAKCQISKEILFKFKWPVFT
jgi:hypothetical protein